MEHTINVPQPEREVNVPLLRKTLEWATAEHHKLRLGLPSQWDQGVWMDRQSCGTVCCLAGKAALEAGWIPMSATEQDDVAARTGRDHNIRHPDGRTGDVEQVADDALGLPEDHSLYGGDNDIYTLWDIAERLTDGKITLPAELAEPV